MSLCVHETYIGFSLTVNDSSGVVSTFSDTGKGEPRGCSSAGRCAFSVDCSASTDATPEALNVSRRFSSGAKSCVVLERSGDTVYGGAVPASEAACSATSGPIGISNLSLFASASESCPGGLIDIVAVIVGVAVGLVVAVLVGWLAARWHERRKARIRAEVELASTVPSKYTEKVETNPIREPYAARRPAPKLAPALNGAGCPPAPDSSHHTDAADGSRGAQQAMPFPGASADPFGVDELRSVGHTTTKPPADGGYDTVAL
jgi:hypothetical protein